MNNLNIISRTKENIKENIEMVLKLIKLKNDKRNKRKNAKLVRGHRDKVPINDERRYRRFNVLYISKGNV